MLCFAFVEQIRRGVFVGWIFYVKFGRSDVDVQYVERRKLSVSTRIVHVNVSKDCHVKHSFVCAIWQFLVVRRKSPNVYFHCYCDSDRGQYPGGQSKHKHYDYKHV